MTETLNTWPEPSERPEPEGSKMEVARARAEKLKSDFERWRQELKEKWRILWQSYWRNLLGLDLPHAENGHTIAPLPSEVPPVQQDEVIPSSYGNLPVETDTPPSSSPETVEPNTPVESWETQTLNPEPAKRVVWKIIEPKEIPSASSVSTDIESRCPIPIEEKNELLPDFHTVQAWETLYGIAKKFNIGLGNLLGINGLDENSTIEINEKIRLKPWIKIKPEQKELPPLPDFHTVVKWDTLSSIAKKYGGLALADLYIFNGLTAKSTLQIGKILALKDWVKVPEQQKKPEEEKKLARGLTRREHIALINNACEQLKVTDKGQIAYILATAEHESGHFLPIYNLVERENRKSWPGFINYDTRADLWNIGPGDGERFKWRGYVQLTGRANYTKYDPILKEEGLINPEQSIITNPDLVLDPKIAAFILVHGMINGNFGYLEIKWKDGKIRTIPAKLGDFINGKKQDWGGARQTVNGNDKAWKIATEAKKILKTL